MNGWLNEWTVQGAKTRVFYATLGPLKCTLKPASHPGHAKTRTLQATPVNGNHAKTRVFYAAPVTLKLSFFRQSYV